MSKFFWLTTIVLIGGLWLAWTASFSGWGLDSDAKAKASRSVRGGSLHTRTIWGGGPGIGK